MERSLLPALAAAGGEARAKGMAGEEDRIEPCLEGPPLTMRATLCAVSLLLVAYLAAVAVCRRDPYAFDIIFQNAGPNRYAPLLRQCLALHGNRKHQRPAGCVVRIPARLVNAHVDAAVSLLRASLFSDT
jgi:hypothetical protein